MKYHIITPMARFDNYEIIKAMLKTHVDKGIDLKWHIIVDDYTKVNIDVKWVAVHVIQNEGTKFFKRCNNAINKYIEFYVKDNSHRHLFLNDDDSYEDNFFEKLNEVDESNEVIIVSMKRGNIIPSDATGHRVHPTNTLIATEENMHPCQVGVEQIILTGSILQRYRFPLHVYGDGMFIEKVVAENKVKYLKDTYALFNYFEEGRWQTPQI